MANWAQLSFQDPASPIMMQLVYFHDHAALILILVLCYVSTALYSLASNSFLSRYILEAQAIELIWTIIPALVLLFLAFPSLYLLYTMDELLSPSMTFKAIGHQWYWSYEYSDVEELSFDAYMMLDSDLNTGEFRLLEVDHRTVLPINLNIRAVITAADVIHAWAVPSLGVKVDAVPGRLNQVGFFGLRSGVYYGQCSEICGANHSFMPISLEMVPFTVFSEWLTVNS
uniref:Cytochrome c oxidase subunit 2 n=1 Tax=Auchenoplax crinita TaxID=397536 RepID=G8XXK9_AUCCR|nr:cytochrome c oxidase subunit II [Auchenoplax crinita]